MSGLAKKKEKEKKQASKAENVEWTSMGETVPKAWKQVLQITFWKYLNIFILVFVLSSRAWLCQAKYVTSVPLMHLIKSIPACLTGRVEAENWLALWEVRVWTTAQQWKGSAFNLGCPKEMYLYVWERKRGRMLNVFWKSSLQRIHFHAVSKACWWVLVFFFIKHDCAVLTPKEDC